MEELKQTEGEKKISQLLIEYMEEKKKNPEGFLEISTALMAGFKATDAYMISKQFGFIERLLEKDKININEEWNDYEKTNLYCNSDFFQLQKHYSYYESLLMLLSIQDEPVKFLSEILK